MICVREGQYQSYQQNDIRISWRLLLQNDHWNRRICCWEVQQSKDCLIFHLSEGIGNSASDFTNSSLSGLSFFIWRIQTCGGERRASGQRHGRGADGASAAGTQRSDSCPATPPARPRLPAAAAPSASARPRQRAKHQLSEGRRRHGNPGTKKGDSYVMAGSRSNVFLWCNVEMTHC